MQRPIWSYVVQWGLWAVIMYATFRWVARSREKAGRSAEPGALFHPPAMLIIGIACSGFFIAIAILSWIYPGKDGSPALSLAFLAFALLGVPMVLDWRNARHAVSETGMRFGTMMGAGGEFSWGQVTSVDFSHSMKWFVLLIGDGRKVRVSLMLTGLPEFARQVLAHVPPAVITPSAQAVLEPTAAGNPPSPWG